MQLLTILLLVLVRGHNVVLIEEILEEAKAGNRTSQEFFANYVANLDISSLCVTRDLIKASQASTSIKLNPMVLNSHHHSRTTLSLLLFLLLLKLCLTTIGILIAAPPIMSFLTCLIFLTSRSIKDLKTKRILLEGLVANGPYQLDLSKANTKLFDDLTVSHNTAAFLSHLTLLPCNACDIATVPTYNSVYNAELISFVAINTNKHSIPKCDDPSSLDTWHAKLGHHSIYVIKTALKQYYNRPLSGGSVSFCNSCKYGKLNQLPFTPSQSKSSHPLQLVFSDVRGSSPVASTSEYRYYVNFVDSYTRYTWIFPPKLKSEVFFVFKIFIASVELLFDRKLKCLQTNWGGEYRYLSPFLAQCGVAFGHPCPYIHQ
ncbi:hypothetical protein ACOSQ3_027384 [Xanthoceras sorbifolium]